MSVRGTDRDDAAEAMEQACAKKLERLDLGDLISEGVFRAATVEFDRYWLPDIIADGVFGAVTLDERPRAGVAEHPHQGGRGRCGPEIGDPMTHTPHGARHPRTRHRRRAPWGWGWDNFDRED